MQQTEFKLEMVSFWYEDNSFWFLFIFFQIKIKISWHQHTLIFTSKSRKSIQVNYVNIVYNNCLIFISTNFSMYHWQDRGVIKQMAQRFSPGSISCSQYVKVMTCNLVLRYNYNKMFRLIRRKISISNIFSTDALACLPGQACAALSNSSLHHFLSTLMTQTRKRNYGIRLEKEGARQKEGIRKIGNRDTGVFLFCVFWFVFVQTSSLFPQ